MADRHLCTFHVGDLFLGVDVTDVQEVIRFQEMTSVPLAPTAVRGLVNLRGQIVTALDLRAMLGLGVTACCDPDALPTNIVIRDGEDALALLVDSIGDVVNAGDDLFESVPPTVTGPVRDLVVGAFKLPGRLLLVLDIDRIHDVRTWTPTVSPTTATDPLPAQKEN